MSQSVDDNDDNDGDTPIENCPKNVMLLTRSKEEEEEEDEDEDDGEESSSSLLLLHCVRSISCCLNRVIVRQCSLWSVGQLLL